MISLVRLSAVSALLLFALAADAAVPVLSSPANDACLATLKGSTTEEGSHKWFFYGLSAADRKTIMNSQPWGKYTNYASYAPLRAKMGNTYGDHPKATTFSWSGTGPFTLTIKRRDGSVFLEKSGIAGTSLSVDNFEIAASYIWTVSNADGTSTPRAFTTEDTVPRLLNGSSQVDYTQGSVTTKVPHGVRDMGGYIGLDGRRARQGLLIRNSAFESDANSSGEAAGMKIKYIDDTNRPFWNEFIKVRTELDLRNNSESTLVQSTLGSGVTYKRFANLPAWKKYMTGTYANSFKKEVKSIFGYLADAGRYPISFHCTHGKDRTGMLAFLIGCVLGYSESDIYADYEATIFWHPTQGVSLETSDANGFVDYLNDSTASGVTGATIQEKAVNFIKSCGVADVQLEVFREIMLEPIEEDEPDEPTPAPVEPEAPDGVDVYDYLQTDGKGYVLTDYTPNLKKTMIEFKVTLLDATVSHGLYVANACTKGDAGCESQMILVLQPSDGTVRYFNQATGDDKRAKLSDVTFDATEEHVVRTFGDTVWYDDRTAQVEGYVETDAKVGGPLQLLAENFSEPKPVCQTYARVAYIKAWEIDGTVTNLVRKWVPAKTANGVATLYEVVNGKYEAVSGSGAAFAVGMNGPARTQNAWTVAPSFTPLAYAAGTAPTFVLGESLYGTPVATYPAARLAKLDGGTYTQTVSVAATDEYTGLSTDFVFTVTGNLPRTPTVAPMENPAWGYVIGGLGETADETAYVFTNTTAAMSWTAPLGVSSVELLVVGGGGAGGDNHPVLSIGGGGGGAGGYVYSKAYAVTGNQPYSVSVGAGAKTAAAKTGGDSAFGDITAKGGGCGGVLSVGQAGGSGGGSSGKKGSSTKYAGGIGIAGQGFIGGSGDGWWKTSHVDSGTGGGGGGAGSKGGDAPGDEQGGIGGAGKTCAITGEEIVYCAGGGGGTDSHNRTPNDERGCYNGIGGVGAGDGGDGNCMNGGDATGYGCGGGGAAGNRDAGQTGGRGFQGIVVVRCAKPAVEVVIGEMVGLAKSGQSVLPADAAVESVEIAADGRSFTWDGRTYEKPHYLFARDGETVIVRIDPAEAAVRSVDAEGADDTFVIGTVLQSVVGFDYSVSYADDLLTQPEGWDRTEPVAGTGGPLELKAPKSGPQRFYRLVVGDGVQ